MARPAASIAGASAAARKPFMVMTATSPMSWDKAVRLHPPPNRIASTLSWTTAPAKPHTPGPRNFAERVPQLPQLASASEVELPGFAGDLAVELQKDSGCCSPCNRSARVKVVVE